MATNTPNLGLHKIDPQDILTLQKYNENFDILDTVIAPLQSANTTIDGRLTALEDQDVVTGGEIDILQAAVTAIQVTLALRKDLRAVQFMVINKEIRYPWTGTAKQIIVNRINNNAEFVFDIEMISVADYTAGLTTWTKVGGQSFSLLATEVYHSFTINQAITADTMLRFTTLNDETDVAVQLFVENNQA